MVEVSEKINSEIGAASASGASWWIEEQRVLTEDLVKERDERYAARIKGALNDLRNRRLDESIRVCSNETGVGASLTAPSNC